MTTIHDDKVKELEEIAAVVRRDTVEAVIEAGSGHIAGPLDLADIFVAFYFHILKHDPQNPLWEERDRLVLSNGHVTPVRYITMAHAGYFPVEDVKKHLRTFGSPYQGHPEREKLPAVETTSGPLGAGLGQAAGMAYAARMDKKKFEVYTILSDGELQAGNTWESAMFVGNNKLANLTAIVDRNNIQINGMTEDVMPLEPLKDKWEAFNWHVLEVDGHNIEAFVDAVAEARAIYEKPVVILAHTIPGKGVDFMEFDYLWHSKSFTSEEAKETLHQLRTLGGKIEGGHMD